MNALMAVHEELRPHPSIAPPSLAQRPEIHNM